MRLPQQAGSSADEPIDTIKARVASSLEMQVDSLQNAAREGRGVLAPTVQLGVPLRMIFADLPDGVPYYILLHNRIADVRDIVNKADPGWKFLFLDQNPARQIMRAFESGAVVICNIDHAYPQAEVTLAPVLGHWAIIPSGIFRIARKLNIPVVPIVMEERPDGACLSSGERIEWPAFEAEPLPIAALLRLLHKHLDAAVARVPDQWIGWGSLWYRWTAWQTQQAAGQKGRLA